MVFPIPHNTLIFLKIQILNHGLANINKKNRHMPRPPRLPIQPKTHRSPRLLTVAKNPNTTLDQIAANVQRDRSSIHRILSKLLSANLVTKETKTIKGGGYYHAYTMVEPEKIKKYAKERVKEITESLEGLIDGFESDLKAHLES